MRGEQYVLVTLLLTKVWPEKAAMLLKQAALPSIADCEQVIWLSEREVVSVQHQDLVKGSDIGQDKGLELKGEAFEVEGGMVPRIGNLSSI